MFLTTEITNPEQLYAIFDGKLCLDDLTLSSILLHSGPSLRVSFDSEKMPFVVPKKWVQNRYNAFSFSLEFIGILDVNIHYWQPIMKCTPVINSNNGQISLRIFKEDSCIISCTSEFLTLRDVSGYNSNLI